MTVGIAGSEEGLLRTVIHESNLDTDAPQVEFSEARGKILPDLSIGADVT